MRVNNGPCKGCQKRTPGCHDICESYQTWRDEYDEEIEKIQEAKNRNRSLNDFRYGSIERARRRH